MHSNKGNENTGDDNPTKDQTQCQLRDGIRIDARGEIYRRAENRKEYCLCILAHPVKCNEPISDFQEYVRGRAPRYDYPISTYSTNDGGMQQYDRMTTPGDGYDTDKERRRTVTLADSVCCVWILEISISDPMSKNLCARFDGRVGA